MLKLLNFKRGIRLCLFLVFLLQSCNQNSSSNTQYPFIFSGPVMGTSFSIKATSLPVEQNAKQVKAAVKTLLEHLNSEMSSYLIDSEVSRFNNSLTTEWQPVSDELYTVVKAAKRVSDLSNGAFDITVAPLVNIWGFGPDPMTFKEPDAAIIKQQLNQIGYRNLKLKGHSKALKKLIPEIEIDLSALAKGYTVDRVAQLLENFGINDYLVEIGGELRLKGLNINKEPWRIAIEEPLANKRTVHKIIPISDVAMATSGDYRNFFEVNGIRYSHTIDPRTGRPVAHKLASVTVLSSQAMQADALATAMMVLGEDKGYKLAEKEKIAALFLVKTDTGFAEKVTSEFNNFKR